MNIPVPFILGILTPLGGFSFILGWVFLTIAIMYRKAFLTYLCRHGSAFKVKEKPILRFVFPENRKGCQTHCFPGNPGRTDSQDYRSSFFVDIDISCLLHLLPTCLPGGRIRIKYLGEFRSCSLRRMLKWLICSAIWVPIFLIFSFIRDSVLPVILSARFFSLPGSIGYLPRNIFQSGEICVMF